MQITVWVVIELLHSSDIFTRVIDFTMGCFHVNIETPDLYSTVAIGHLIYGCHKTN